MADDIFPLGADGYTSKDTDWGFRAYKSIEFDGDTEDAVGDVDGSNNPYTLFKISGTVLVRVVAFCTENITNVGDSQISVGVDGNQESIIPLTVSTDIVSGELWYDSTPTTKVDTSDNIAEYIVANGKDIKLYVTVKNVKTGKLSFIVSWYPLSKGSLLETV